MWRLHLYFDGTSQCTFLIGPDPWSTLPDTLAFSTVVNLADLAALLPAAATEAVLQPGRLPVVRIVGGDVAPVASLVGLHLTGALGRAWVAVRSQFGTTFKEEFNIVEHM